MASTIILHIDMDAFFASVEQMDDPSLRNKCVVVGGKSQRGVVAAASYEARKYGIHSAMPIFQARQRCRNLVIVPPRRKRYIELSRKIMAILRDFSPLVEPISIDEAFVDITGCQRLHGTCDNIAAAIKEKILREVGLTCSVGVAPNKFLAKLGSGLNKPDGLTVIDQTWIEQTMPGLPIRRPHPPHPANREPRRGSSRPCPGSRFAGCGGWGRRRRSGWDPSASARSAISSVCRSFRRGSSCVEQRTAEPGA